MRFCIERERARDEGRLEKNLELCRDRGVYICWPTEGLVRLNWWVIELSIVSKANFFFFFFFCKVYFRGLEVPRSYPRTRSLSSLARNQITRWEWV